MKQTQLNAQFEEILEPLGSRAADFFLAASLYHSRKVSFEAAAALADLSFEDFNQRLQEHFEHGYSLADEVVLEDINTIKNLPV